jgi:membrane-associated phospholipid phosphatase
MTREAPGPPLVSSPAVDYRLYHAIDSFSAHHKWLAHAFSALETYGIFVFAAAAFALWLLARPGGSSRWKLASASALAAGALALLVNQVISKTWHRDRPYQTHPNAYHLSSAKDASFPSDHASAAFGIAFAVFLFDRLVGSFFLAAAVLIAVGRVFIGVHYPGDVLASLAVGLGAALLVVRVARPLLAFLVRVVERITDPLLAPIWRRTAR